MHFQIIQIYFLALIDYQFTFLLKKTFGKSFKCKIAHTTRISFQFPSNFPTKGLQHYCNCLYLYFFLSACLQEGSPCGLIPWNGKIASLVSLLLAQGLATQGRTGHAYIVNINQKISMTLTIHALTATNNTQPKAVVPNLLCLKSRSQSFS